MRRCPVQGGAATAFPRDPSEEELPMEQKLQLTGLYVAQVRPMTEEECDREGWPDLVGATCLVLSNGGIVYPASDDGRPGVMLAQHDHVIWEVDAEAEPSQVKMVARDVLRRTELAATTLAIMFGLAALVSLWLGLADVGTLVEPHLGIGAVGQALAAVSCLVLRGLVRASRIATEAQRSSSRVGRD